MRNRFIRVIPCPTTEQVQRASCGWLSNLPIGYEVQLWHHGEDGPTLELHNIRGECFLDHENTVFDEFQAWYANELMDAVYLDYEPDEPNHEPEAYQDLTAYHPLTFETVAVPWHGVPRPVYPFTPY